MDTLDTLSTSTDGAAQPPDSCLGVRIIGHPDARRIGEWAALFDGRANGPRHVSRLAPVFRSPSGVSMSALGSSSVSRTPLELERHADGTVALRVARADAHVEIGVVPLRDEHVLSAAEALKGVVITLGNDVALWFGELVTDCSGQDVDGLLGFSKRIHTVRRDARRLAPTERPVLLRGETGVGKELVARALHAHSRRQQQPYVVVNMAAVVPAVAAAELFGHRKGAFTGADQGREGFFAEAHAGTLFLDEIGDLDAEVQPKLLRAMEYGEIQPVGGSVRQVDVRVVAATESNLEDAVNKKRFRTALLQRFVHEIRLPALRDRREDVGVLFAHFLTDALASVDARARMFVTQPEARGFVPARVLARLCSAHFSGNVRQLRNVAERFALDNYTCARATDMRAIDELLADDPLPDQPLVAPPGAPSSVLPPRRVLPGEEEVRAAMIQEDFNVTRAAAVLGVSTRWLHPFLESSVNFPRATDLGKPEIDQAIEAARGDVEAAARNLHVSAHGLKLRMKVLGIRR